MDPKQPQHLHHTAQAQRQADSSGRRLALWAACCRGILELFALQWVRLRR